MTTKLFFISILLATLISCNQAIQNKVNSDPDSATTSQNSLTNHPNDKSEITEINCDSIFKGKGISIQLISLDTNKVDGPEYEYIFLVMKQQNGQSSEIYRDTIISTVQQIQFADFNNDGVKDILVQNESDVRSNWTYYLYVVDKNADSIRKIKGFEEIKNPNYLPKYDLIDNMVMSGRNWTGFYKIAGDTIKDFNIEIYDGEDENGKVTYDNDYKNALNKILAGEKNKR